MQFGDIIKRSWNITWRYKALWILGLFAGISGCNGGGGSGGGGGGGDFESFDLERAVGQVPGVPDMRDLAILAVVVGTVLVVLGIVWFLLGVAARAGLVHAVNSIETGARPSLRESWKVGFSHFWPVLGLTVLLALPMIVIVGGMMAAILVPLLGAGFAGGEPSGAVIAPICGSLLIGLPLVFLATFVLGLLSLIALRYIVLGNMGVIESIKAAWSAIRYRFKDNLLMWLINWGLNVAASAVVAIPIIVVTLALGIPALIGVRDGNWGQLAGLGIGLVLMWTIISLVYGAIWGVFTSALWTIFFRRLTGMEPLPQPAPAYATAAYGPQPPTEQYPPAGPQPPAERPPAEPEPPADPRPPAGS